MGGGVSTQASDNGYNGNLAGAIVRDKVQFTANVEASGTSSLLGMVAYATQAANLPSLGAFLSREEMKAEFQPLDELLDRELGDDDWVGEFVDCFRHPIFAFPL